MLKLSNIAKKFFCSTNERRIKKLKPLVNKINSLEKVFKNYTDKQLKLKTKEFRHILSKDIVLDNILIEAFAVVREASKRILGMRPFDVQILGGIVLHQRGIAEMRTGEGKTLMATLPVYLNALEGKGVHVVTVNDYLAVRDAEMMGKLYKFLGLTTGIIKHGMGIEERRFSYASDITYGTNNELGFDYLRDNMSFDRNQMVQRGYNYAIIDEVDSILIDEARTPLIISGPLEDRSHFYNKIDKIIPILLSDDYDIDEKQKTATFTEKGIEKIENILTKTGYLKDKNLYDIENISIVHHINNSLKAYKLFKKDKDYIVKKNKIIIIDEFTGRMMPGRRYSDGLHQALEAKERVNIHPENQTLASITFQNYFRMYKKLSGMTGTAATEAEEFNSIYNLEVVTIPTNLPVKRIDEDDEIYVTEEEKYFAIIQDIKKSYLIGQPVLIGTTSIEKSEKLGHLLKKNGINSFQVLNARYHEQEAYIISQAGVPGTLTIATNMAGRGTDIQLGGNIEMRIKKELKDMPEGLEKDKKSQAILKDIYNLKKQTLNSGGLYVLATERHESRRIDNQLRGRSGRQGDPGKSKFFLSLEDDLMRIFGSNSINILLKKLGLKKNEAITHPWINKALEKAQKRVEYRNFEIRKNLLRYDDVINNQRKVIFEQRMEIIDAVELNYIIDEMYEEILYNLIEFHFPEGKYIEECTPEKFIREFKKIFIIDINISRFIENEINKDKIFQILCYNIKENIIKKTKNIEKNVIHFFQKIILLQSIDFLWREHLYNIEQLRSIICFRGYAQRDPLNEYKNESFELFQKMLIDFRIMVVSKFMRFQIFKEKNINYNNY